MLHAFAQDAGDTAGTASYSQGRSKVLAQKRPNLESVDGRQAQVQRKAPVWWPLADVALQTIYRLQGLRNVCDRQVTSIRFGFTQRRAQTRCNTRTRIALAIAT